jgi:hypothetical protein
MARREPFPHDDLVEEMARTFRDVQRTLAAQIQSAISQGRLEFAAERRMQYAAVLATLDRLGAQTDQQARKVVSDAFKEGAGKTGAQISQQAGFAVSVPFSFTGVQQDAIEALQREVVDSLGISRRMVGRSVEDLYAKAGRRATVRALLGADGSPQIAARRLKADLVREPYVKRLIEKGGTGFTDRAGKKWSLQSYSEMVVRTTTRKAVVEGQIAKMASLGVNLARVSTHASACPICVPKQGRLVSLDGSTSDYNGEAVADLSSVGAPPYHPNCRHTLQPVVADIEALRQKMQGSPPSQPVTITNPTLPKPTPAKAKVAKAASKPGSVPKFAKGPKGKREAEDWLNENLLIPADERLPLFDRWAQQSRGRGSDGQPKPPPETVWANASVEAVQSVVEGIQDVLGGTGIRLNSARVLRPQGRARATYSQFAGDKPGEIRFKPGIMKGLKASAKDAEQNRDFYRQRSERDIARVEERIRLWRELGGADDGIKTDLTILEQLKATKRWSISSESSNPVRATARHEAGHALMEQTPGFKTFWKAEIENIPTIDRLRVSEYAASIPEELWAETVAAIQEGVAIPKSVRTAYETVMRRFGYGK